MKTYFKFWKNAFHFDGRATRGEFWIPLVVNLAFASLIAGSYIGSGDFDAGDLSARFFTAIFFIPGASVTLRRLHDRNLSGATLLLMLLPIIGWIAIGVIAALPGTKGANRFGPDPQQPEPSPTSTATEVA